MYWYLKKVHKRFGDRLFRFPKLYSVEQFFSKITDIGGDIWPEVMNDLKQTFEKRTNEVIKLDGIGSGKTSYAVGVVLYTLYLLGCLKDPTLVFPGLGKRTNIAIVLMSLRDIQAKKLMFDVVKAHLDATKWFRVHYRYQEEGSKIITFFNNVSIISGSSSESVPIGYNVILGVADEGNWMLKQSHIGDSLDQLENVYNSMKDRIETRFLETGIIVLVSSIRVPDAFMVQRAEAVQEMDNVYVTKRPQWMVKPGKWSPYFVVDIQSMSIVEELTEECIYDVEPGGRALVSIPIKLKESYERNPRRFLRDRASIAVISESSFVVRPDAMKVNMVFDNPVENGRIADWFKPQRRTIYYSHNDLGMTKDALCLSIGHQEGRFTLIDLVYIIDPKEEGKVDFESARQIFYELQQRGFKFGLVTFDSFQSFDTVQRFNKKGIKAEIFSVDRDTKAYDMWLEANYTGEFRMPIVRDRTNQFKDYMFNVRSLVMKGTKVDHIPRGAKDITDSVAGTTYHCRTLGFEQGKKVAGPVLSSRNKQSVF